MSGHDDGPLSGLVAELRAAYPEWVIGITHCHGGPRLIAYRDGCPAGLYAVITADAGELHRELESAAAPARAAS